MFTIHLRRAAVAVLSIAALAAFSSEATAQREQYKIQPDGIVLKLKRVNVTTFQYAPHARAELRRNRAGAAIWYFKAETGKEYTAPAPDQPAAPRSYTVAQLNAAFNLAKTRGEIPTAVRTEVVRGVPMFQVKFERNTLDLRWHAQVAMDAREFDVVNRTLLDQGYRSLFSEPYVESDRSTRFVAAWRR